MSPPQKTGQRVLPHRPDRRALVGLGIRLRLGEADETTVFGAAETGTSLLAGGMVIPAAREVTGRATGANSAGSGIIIKSLTGNKSGGRGGSGFTGKWWSAG